MVVTGMLHSTVCFQGIKSSVVPHLFNCVFFSNMRKTSIGLVVSASSCGLLQALGQTKLRVQPAVPKGMERVLRARSEFLIPSTSLQKGGRGQEKREQWTHSGELIPCSFPAIPIFPVGWIEAVLSFYCTYSSGSVRSKTVSCWVVFGKKIKPWSIHLALQNKYMS